MSYPSNNIVDALGISWSLEVQEFARLYYDHPTSGMLEYVGSEKWLCDNVNTLTLSQSGTLPDGVLPRKVCVRPSYNSADCGCYDKGGCYTPPEVQCQCKDPCCECMDEFISFACPDGTASCSAKACKGGRAGLENPSGPSYELCCTLMGNDICVVNYCSGGQWKRDFYCNGTHLSTCNADLISKPCEPLKLAPCRFVGCEGCVACVGEDCDPPEPPSCCSLAPGSSLTVTITPQPGCACTDSSSFTITDGITPGVFQGTGTVCGGPVQISGVSCFEGVWSILGGIVAFGCGFSTTAANEVDCPSVLVNFSVDCNGCGINIEVSS